jgi:hypothetical protein
MKLFISRAIGVPFLDRGRDFDGWDCWGLVVAFYREVYHLTIESCDELSIIENPKEAIRAMIERAKRWTLVDVGQEHTGNVAIWRPAHASIVLPGRRMLHCLEGKATCIERYNHTMWRQRLIGFHRHA